MSVLKFIGEHINSYLKKGFFRDSFSRNKHDFFFDIVKTGIDIDEDYIRNTIERWIWLLEPKLRSVVSVRSGIDHKLAPRRREGKDLFRWTIENIVSNDTVEISRLETIDHDLNIICGEVSRYCIARPTISLISINRELNRRIKYELKKNAIFFCVLGKVKVYTPKDEMELTSGDFILISKPSELFFESFDGISFVLNINLNLCNMTDIVSVLIDAVISEDHNYRKTTFSDSVSLDLLSKKEDFLKYAGKEDFFLKSMNNLILELSDTYRVSPGGHIKGIMSAKDISMDSTLKRRSGSNMVIIEFKDDLRIFVPGCGEISVSESFPSTISFPKEAKEILKSINSTSLEFTLRDLSPSYSDSSKIATARKLLKEGFLQLV